MREITDSLLIQLAGEAAFNRGVRYFKEGRVEGLEVKRTTISATVAGSEDYAVRLKHTSRIFEGSCACPASDGFDFCKHCVATALAYKEVTAKTDTLKKTKTKDRLPVYLMSLEKKELVEMLLEQLKNDRATLNQLKIKAEIAAGNMDEKSIKKQITAAIPYNKHYYRYHDVRAYFGKIELALETLADAITKLSPAAALRVIDYAYERTDRATDTIDDSGGFRFDTLNILAEMHLQTLARAELPPEELATYLLTLYNGPSYDFYPEVPDAYEQLLGPAGYDIFINKVQQAWDSLPPITVDDWEVLSPYRHLQTPLLKDAEKRHDGDAIVALYTKTSTGFRDFIKMALLCLDFDKAEQAAWWFERAKRAPRLGNHEKKALEDTQIALWLYHKDYESADKALWQRFAALPSVAHYNEILAIPGVEDSRDRQEKAIELTRQSINKITEDWARQIKTDTLAELYLLFNRQDQALEHAEQNKLDPRLLLQIALVNGNQPLRAIPLIYRLVDFSLNMGGNDAYRHAIEALKAAREIAGQEHLPGLIKQLNALLVEYKRKRNFCLWTKEAFADLL